MTGTGRQGRFWRWVVVTAALFAVLLVAKSVVDFTRTGPAISAQIEAHYLGYAAYAVARLGFHAFLISWLLAAAGALVYALILPDRYLNAPGAVAASAVGIGIGSGYAFAWALVHEPGTLMASWLYSPDHLVRAWFRVNPEWLPAIGWALLALVSVAALKAAAGSFGRGRRAGAMLPLLVPAVLVAVPVSSMWEAPVERKGAVRSGQRPNILLIGADTLRADRLGVAGYGRKLTPAIDRLAAQGTWFFAAYAPIGRTAPSMTSLLTGAWPRNHGVTSNFIPDEATRLPVKTLPAVLRENGYRTAVVGDWAASDLGKIRFGFDEVETAPDQWNLKYLIRQGPKDLRLFLSLFTHNAVGRWLLPEIYYLAGRPLTRDVGRDARRMIDRLSDEGRPFFLVVFVATTHAPFGSSWPYYTLFSGREFRGSSKFTMTDVFTPEDIARRQAEGAEAFDVRQIIDLYDGAVREFDDEVARILGHLARRGLDDSTIVVIFSDHGVDFFENGTWGQGNTVTGDDYSNRVPLVIRDPAREGGGRVAATVRSIDLAPTLLELAGLDPELLDTDGRSLVPLMDGRERRDRPACFATGLWVSRVVGMPDDHLPFPPLLEMLDIPDIESGTLALRPEAREQVEQVRDRALRLGEWKLVRIPTQAGARYRLYRYTDHGAREIPVTEAAAVAACLRPPLDAWARSPTVPERLECPGGGDIGFRP